MVQNTGHRGLQRMESVDKDVAWQIRYNKAILASADPAETVTCASLTDPAAPGPSSSTQAFPCKTILSHDNALLLLIIIESRETTDNSRQLVVG